MRNLGVNPRISLTYAAFRALENKPPSGQGIKNYSFSVDTASFNTGICSL
jgi:hypothetical protein